MRTNTHLATERPNRLRRCIVAAIKKEFGRELEHVGLDNVETPDGVIVDQLTVRFPETPADWLDQLTGDQMIFREFAVSIEPLDD